MRNLQRAFEIGYWPGLTYCVRLLDIILGDGGEPRHSVFDRVPGFFWPPQLWGAVLIPRPVSRAEPATVFERDLRRAKNSVKA
jgi:hypothetical protein